MLGRASGLRPTRWPWAASVLLALAFFALLEGGPPAAAQEPSRAGVVVQHGDGTVRAACVLFDEPEISGAELLRRSGLDVVMAVEGGLMVCSIAGEGCQYPQEPCFCQCQGQGPCTYWSYWHLDPRQGRWVYSSLGAGAYRVRNGDVDGWRWGSGTPGQAAAPPVLTFEEVCGDEAAALTPVVLAPTPTPTARGGLQVMPSVTPEPPPPATPGPRLTPTPAPTPTPARGAVTATRPQDDDGGPTFADYLFFVAVGLFLIVGAFLTARRRRRQRWEE